MMMCSSLFKTKLKSHSSKVVYGNSLNLMLRLEPNHTLMMLGHVINVWVVVSTLALHLGQRIVQGLPLLLSSLRTCRELLRTLHKIILWRGIVWRDQIFFHIGLILLLVEAEVLV